MIFQFSIKTSNNLGKRYQQNKPEIDTICESGFYKLNCGFGKGKTQSLSVIKLLKSFTTRKSYF